MRKGQIKEFCSKCGNKRHKLNNGRYICSECQKIASKISYHKNKRPLTEIQKKNKRISNIKWKHTVRDSGFTNQQIAVIKNRYGLSEVELVKLVEDQGCKCKICTRSLNKTKGPDKGSDLCVDHCHKTDSVRGLLCRDCNFAIGLLKDSIDNINRAITYLKKS